MKSIFIMERALYENLNRKFGYKPYHTWFVNARFDKVVAIRNANNEGSGPGFYYTDFVELWEKKDNTWKRISREEVYSEPQKARAEREPNTDEYAAILCKENGGGFNSHNNMVVH